MKRIVMGLVAHVDAGKTTLAEAILYYTGCIRKAGRVDNGDTVMDHDDLEKQRGITIFSSQANINFGNMHLTLLDTPGHVDFSSETERVIQVLDYAALVISGTEGVQAHTKTLWKILEHYHIPTFLFITKMDYRRFSREDLMKGIRQELSENAFDFSLVDDPDTQESLAMCSNELMEEYLASGSVSEQHLKSAISARQIIPCWFGSGLRQEGIQEFLDGIDRYTQMPVYGNEFSARAFKVSRDAHGKRIVHLKITGGSLHTKDTVRLSGQREAKVNQIRQYTGNRFEQCDSVCSGDICCVEGLEEVNAGDCLGAEAWSNQYILDPVMNYRLRFPDGVDAKQTYLKLKALQEEDPQLHLSWVERLQEIHVSLMGKIQIEILKSIIKERYDLDAEIDNGSVIYKETIRDTVEGVGHFEPLRHYAEVHILLEPLPCGSGLQFESRCSEDDLDRNWQRLILGNLMEKEHCGVLTGSPITDVRFVLVSGKAHVKHTEGGDFRQAVYRAVRQGLMQADSVLLEPYYEFTLELPNEFVGRAISDLKLRNAILEPFESGMETTVFHGEMPVTTAEDYSVEIASYSSGRGRFSCVPGGYHPCHNESDIIRLMQYNPESDPDNTPDSVFCSHGSGTIVHWKDVPKYQHLPSYLKPDNGSELPIRNHRITIDDRELEEIMTREFGPISRRQYSAGTTVPATGREVETRPLKLKHLIVDGYNVIFAWKELKEIASQDLSAARSVLLDLLSNYAAYTKDDVVIVFDGYRVPGNQGEKTSYHNIHVVYTREHETADLYIEKLIEEIGKNDSVRVITSDGLIQLATVRSGLLRISAREFEEEVAIVMKNIRDLLERQGTTTVNRLKDNLKV